MVMINSNESYFYLSSLVISWYLSKITNLLMRELSADIKGR